MAPDDENKTPAEKFTELVNEAAGAVKKRTSRDLQPNLHETLEIADQAAVDAVRPVRFQTRLQWGVIGALVLGGGSFLGWCLIEVTSLSAAQAQTREVADQTKLAYTEHVKDDAQWKRIQEQQNEEARKDAVDLYRAVMDKRRSHRLERDGGFDE